MTKARDSSIKDDDAKDAGATKAPATPNVDLKQLLAKSHLILEREVKQLTILSATALLDRDASLALVNYVKLLKELIKDEDKLLDDLSDEELEQIMKDRK